MFNGIRMSCTAGGWVVPASLTIKARRVPFQNQSNLLNRVGINSQNVQIPGKLTENQHFPKHFINYSFDFAEPFRPVGLGRCCLR